MYLITTPDNSNKTSRTQRRNDGGHVSFQNWPYFLQICAALTRATGRATPGLTWQCSALLGFFLCNCSYIRLIVISNHLRYVHIIKQFIQTWSLNGERIEIISGHLAGCFRTSSGVKSQGKFSKINCVLIFWLLAKSLKLKQPAAFSGI